MYGGTKSGMYIQLYAHLLLVLISEYEKLKEDLVFCNSLLTGSDFHTNTSSQSIRKRQIGTLVWGKGMGIMLIAYANEDNIHQGSRTFCLTLSGIPRVISREGIVCTKASLCHTCCHDNRPTMQTEQMEPLEQSKHSTPICACM